MIVGHHVLACKFRNLPAKLTIDYSDNWKGLGVNQMWSYEQNSVFLGLVFLIPGRWFVGDICFFGNKRLPGIRKASKQNKNTEVCSYDHICLTPRPFQYDIVSIDERVLAGSKSSGRVAGKCLFYARPLIVVKLFDLSKTNPGFKN